MGGYFYDGKQQSESRGRITIKDGVIDGIVMLRGSADINGKNVEFLGRIVSELIETVNQQHKEISELKEKITS